MFLLDLLLREAVDRQGDFAELITSRNCWGVSEHSTQLLREDLTVSWKQVTDTMKQRDALTFFFGEMKVEWPGCLRVWSCSGGRPHR